MGKVYAPVNGEIAESNQELETNPALINEDCYGKGWMYKIRPDDAGEIENLIHGTEAVQKWMDESFEKYKQE